MGNALAGYSHETMDLFDAQAETAGPDESIDRTAPLATRMRPRTLAEFEGHEKLLGEGKVLRRLIEAGRVGSIILWGPSGTGKTTLARIIARDSQAAFEPFSAVSEGVPRIREIVTAAERRKRNRAEATLMFLDEVHALSRNQQDVLLPHVESGLLQLVAATTENVSFELNRALLSRCRVFVLEPLQPAEIRRTLCQALADEERGLGEWGLEADDAALDLIAELADGDARRGLTLLETAAALVSQGGRIDEAVVRDAAQERVAQYDKGRDSRYALISAFQKSIRNSDADAAVYYLARMIEGGEDHRYIGRRLAVIAAEDVSLADPNALPVTMAAIENMEFVGPPEGWLAFAEATLYLATAPKSNRAYAALKAARAAVRENPTAPVPKHLQNAPTELMAELGHGREYDYPFDHPDHVSAQACLPDEMRGRKFFDPSRFGYEKQIAKRMHWWAERKGAVPGGEGTDGPVG